MDFFTERRKYKRIECDFNVILIINPDMSIAISCNGRDISEGGIRVMLSTKTLEGSEAVVNFNLPGYEDTLKIRSKVIWTQPSIESPEYFESGIEFVSLNEVEKAILRDYVSQQE